MKVSVVVTAYNHVRFIARALDSVLEQDATFDWEVIVGDDCSQDGTRDVIRDYERRHPALIRTVFPTRNLGVAGRDLFVETLRESQGRFIAMLDGDDYWTAPDKLQRQVDFLDAHPECSMCYHNVLVLREDGAAPPAPSLPPGHPPFSETKDLLWTCFIPSCSPMVRREVVEELPPWYLATPWADYALYVLASEYGRLGYIDDVMGVYRIHAGGVWSGLDRVARIHGVLRSVETLGEGIRRRHGRTIRQIRAYQHYKLARLHVERGDTWPAIHSLLRSFWLDPGATGAGRRRLMRLAWRTARRAAAATRTAVRSRPEHPRQPAP